MTFQRVHGQEAFFLPTKKVIDQRGNRVITIDPDKPKIRVTAAFYQNRANRAEVPGQQDVNVYQMTTYADLPDVNMWSIVEWRGRTYDIVSPPGYYHGASRHVRHWTLMIRQRPNVGPGVGELP